MTLTARAYAKINLFLDVTGKRSDGYHNLSTIMQSVGIYDEITLTTVKDGITVMCDKEELSGEDNIVYKACKAFFGILGCSFGVLININKNIPVAAGLGGGSADAAAVLLLLNKMCKSPFTVDQLMPVAASLGADVPFFLIGGTAMAEGIGDILTRKPSCEFNYVIVKKGEKQSTAKMYSLLDKAEYEKNGNINSLLLALKSGDINGISNNIFNAFENCWDMKNLKAPFAQFSPSAVFLSGSGPAVCALFDDSSAAIDCEKALKTAGINAFYAKSMPFGIEIV